MTRALCLGGPMDGKWMEGPNRFRLQTVARMPVSLFPDDESSTQDIKAVFYRLEHYNVLGEEFPLYIPEGTDPRAAFRQLLEGYKPKETDR